MKFLGIALGLLISSPILANDFEENKKFLQSIVNSCKSAPAFQETITQITQTDPYEAPTKTAE